MRRGYVRFIVHHWRAVVITVLVVTLLLRLHLGQVHLEQL